MRPGLEEIHSKWSRDRKGGRPAAFIGAEKRVQQPRRNYIWKMVELVLMPLRQRFLTLAGDENWRRVSGISVMWDGGNMCWKQKHWDSNGRCWCMQTHVDDNWALHVIHVEGGRERLAAAITKDVHDYIFRTKK
jgi:hypothetical protein